MRAKCVSGGGGVKVYSKRAVGMSGIRANETIYSGQNRYYCKWTGKDRKRESTDI